jgi:hypothetical protein
MPPTPSQRLKVASGVGRSAISTRGGAHAQREAQAVAQAVGEEELGRREAAYRSRCRSSTPLAVELGGPVGIGLLVHGALGRPVEPEE